INQSRIRSRLGEHTAFRVRIALQLRKLRRSDNGEGEVAGGILRDHVLVLGALWILQEPVQGAPQLRSLTGCEVELDSTHRPLIVGVEHPHCCTLRSAGQANGPVPVKRTSVASGVRLSKRVSLTLAVPLCPVSKV